MILIIFLLIIFQINADENGNCGSECLYTFSNGELRIYGNGNMTANYYNSNEVGGTSAPWKKYREKIIKVVIENGIKKLWYSNASYYV